VSQKYQACITLLGVLGERHQRGCKLEKVIIELKSVERITNAHKKQLLTYLRLTGIHLGYLLNFGEALMGNGITRTVNGLKE